MADLTDVSMPPILCNYGKTRLSGFPKHTVTKKERSLTSSKLLKSEQLGSLGPFVLTSGVSVVNGVVVIIAVVVVILGVVVVRLTLLLLQTFLLRPLQ